eukprot:6704345-Prymnesium_polylepis.2
MMRRSRNNDCVVCGLKLVGDVSEHTCSSPALVRALRAWRTWRTVGTSVAYYRVPATVAADSPQA